MKYTRIILNTLLAFILIGFAACDKKFTSVNFDYKTEGTIQSNAFPSTGTHTFGEMVLNSDLEAELQKNNASLDLLDELRLKSIEISTLDSGSNFDPIESLEIWLEAPGKPEVLIAGKNPVPDGLTTVEMEVSNGDNLQDYLKGESFTYRIKGTNSGPVAAMNLKIKAVWGVKASAK